MIFLCIFVTSLAKNTNNYEMQKKDTVMSQNALKQYYDKFLTALEDRYPQKYDLVQALSEILLLEKESIYRRLRKDVLFSAEEIMRIANMWSMSLDNIVCTNPEKIRPFHYEMVDWNSPTEDDYSILERFNRNMELVASDPDGKMYEVLNSLPRGIHSRSDILTRFFTMKWHYKYGAEGKPVALKDIKITDRMRQLDMEHVDRVYAIKEVHSFFDNGIFQNIVNDIAYFHLIGMLTTEEKAALREDLLSIVDYIEGVAASGRFPSGSKLYFYLSHTWVDMEYVFYESRYLNLTLIRMLERNVLTSTDRIVSDRLKNMVRSMRRMSALISESNALMRREFFDSQRKIIAGL